MPPYSLEDLERLWITLTLCLRKKYDDFFGRETLGSPWRANELTSFGCVAACCKSSKNQTAAEAWV